MFTYFSLSRCGVRVFVCDGKCCGNVCVRCVHTDLQCNNRYATYQRNILLHYWYSGCSFHTVHVSCLSNLTKIYYYVKLEQVTVKNERSSTFFDLSIESQQKVNQNRFIFFVLRVVCMYESAHLILGFSRANLIT